MFSACSFDTWPTRGTDDVEQPMIVGEATAPHTEFGNPLDGTAGAPARSQASQEPTDDAPAMRTPGWSPPTPTADSGAGASVEPDAAVDPDTSVPDAAAPEPPDAAVLDDARATQPAPPPGTLFGECTVNTDCTTGLVCTSALMPFLASAHGYCTAFCGSTGSAIDVCPQPADGMVRAICRPEIALCVLDSCAGSECPAGMSCLALDSPVGNGEKTYWCSP